MSTGISFFRLRFECRNRKGNFFFDRFASTGFCSSSVSKIHISPREIEHKGIQLCWTNKNRMHEVQLPLTRLRWFDVNYGAQLYWNFQQQIDDVSSFNFTWTKLITHTSFTVYVKLTVPRRRSASVFIIVSLARRFQWLESDIRHIDFNVKLSRRNVNECNPVVTK